ncbi:CheW protein [Nitrosomonas eutropha]|uniref:chemotaxis protein CheW n=1 Tax=Nitrosomonas TaxID=914 RepID=UPI000886B4F2|nr:MULTISPECIES: chemotaxis protein CheW [Nitrosomonas]MXS81198.1 chemotaxis protein CheW [Nitrosomonas sp. GH22]SCX22159.1 CheW protein [Nitrosomonas eutropha]SDW59970.1 CheW protein [Nitrosomonas eutropha]
MLTEQINNKTQEVPLSIPVLGVTIGEDRWLIPMDAISEILPVPKITPVFLTHLWFLGIINVRGNIYGLCDLAHYLDKKTTRINVRTRVFLTDSHPGTGYAILAESVLGIRDLMEFTRQPDHEDERSVIADVYNDRQNRLWRKLNLPALVRLKSFLQASS